MFSKFLVASTMSYMVAGDMNVTKKGLGLQQEEDDEWEMNDNFYKFENQDEHFNPDLVPENEK